MFHFHVAQFVKIRLPTTLLCEIVSHAFTNENVAGIPAIHHSLRDVDAYAGNVFALVCILHLMDRAAVDSHSHRQTWLRAQSVADLQGAFNRLFHRTGENQRHAIAGRQNGELCCSLGFARRFGAAHNLVQLLKRF